MRILVLTLMATVSTQGAFASERSNADLSNARAEAVKELLGQDITPQPQPQGDGERQPNRRVEIAPLGN